MSSSKAICKLLRNLANKLVIAQNTHTVCRRRPFFLIVWTAGIIIQFEFTRGRHIKAPDVSRHCGRWMQILTAVTTPKGSNGIDPHKFPSWRKLIRVTARISRLAVKIRLKKYDQHGQVGPLTPEELQQAEIYWINQAQTTLYSRLDRGEFKSPSPFKDETVLSELEEEWMKLSCPMKPDTPPFFQVTTGSPSNKTRSSGRTLRCSSHHHDRTEKTLTVSTSRCLS